MQSELGRASDVKCRSTALTRAEPLPVWRAGVGPARPPGRRAAGGAGRGTGRGPRDVESEISVTTDMTHETSALRKCGCLKSGLFTLLISANGSV